ncbi:arabinose efflux permease family protein [Desulfosporosinus orientis DSM 765]|uniref:Arabinose efflux permease family protein n=1 Tax=Desulfosporosinus orientis (strain ATCC 19365 / DSM 765 / NCIMB 8382 / VKM B-1628 / Singapore I) TaxID=768706 RepID=G7W657_DESOD|nr:MFS transporter [Desulfosporosinus orientis]AET67719.1 arabinose efflux permease family protein [Desulfosporosinus orientis DSM 765]
MAGSTVNGAAFFDGREISRCQRQFLWIAALAYAFDQVDIMNFAFASPVLMKSYGWTMENVARVNSSNMIGMFFGALFGGWIADRIGRKRGLITCIAIFSLASLITASMVDYQAYVVLRFFAGFGTIGMVTIAMGYISEMMPAERRGKVQAMTIASGTIAIPMAAIFAKIIIPISPNSWRCIFILGGLGIILIFFSFKMLRESPRWLVSKGRLEEAARVLEEISPGATLPDNAYELARNKNASYAETIKVIFSKNYIGRTITVFIVVFAATLGTFYLMAFYPAVHLKMGFTASMIASLAIYQNLTVPFGDFGVSFVADKGGRKNPIVVYFLISGFLFILQGLFSNTLPISIIFLIRGLFTSGAMTLTWTYLAESYPTHIRASANGIMFGTGRILASLLLFTVPLVFQTYGYFGVHLVNGLLYIVPAFVVLAVGQKTAKISLEALHLSKDM